MIFKGFKFGILLQFAIGPVCIFIFQVAISKGFYAAESGVLGVTIIDSIFITIATLGITSLLNRKNIKSYLKIFGEVILFVFGLNIVLNEFNINFMPSLCLSNSINSSNNEFFHATILTASNPLTIIFWAGVFSSKILEEAMERKVVISFGIGAVIATMFFLTIVALLGSLAQTFLSASYIKIFNIIVGGLLICFSMKMAFKKS